MEPTYRQKNLLSQAIAITERLLVSSAKIIELLENDKNFKRKNDERPN